MEKLEYFEAPKIVFDDGVEFLLPDISYEKFTEYMFKSGGSDTEYKYYLDRNNMKDITDFNSESIGELTLIFTHDDRVVKFRCVYDSDNFITNK